MGERMRMSYAQNLEDYHLDLLFADQEIGTYVDVGGGHPVADNVSFWFYLKGWRGLVVEPQQRLADIYAHVRPRDSVVSCLAGRAHGESDFYVVETLHRLSTTVQEHAIHSQKSFGVDYKIIRKPVRALSSLLQGAGITHVDFLKIDAEGAEADVIAGMDLKGVRPRVMLIEAEVPGTMPEAWRSWEPELLGEGYGLAFQDGLNRWYVLEEEAALRARFPSKPTDWHSVQHLWHCGRAPDKPDHPDNALAVILQHGFFALLPSLDRVLLEALIERGLAQRQPKLGATPAVARQLLGAAEYPGPHSAVNLPELLDSDALRGALGRIACAYDGGHIME
jgi:FkbM family methyltransferase